MLDTGFLFFVEEIFSLFIKENLKKAKKIVAKCKEYKNLPKIIENKSFVFSLVFCLRLDIVKFVLFIFFSFLNCIYFLVFFSFLYFLSFFFSFIFFFFSFLELYLLANFILYFLHLKIIFFLKFFVNLTCCLSYFTKSQNFSFLEKRNDILFPISVFFLKIEHLFTKKKVFKFAAVKH